MIKTKIKSINIFNIQTDREKLFLCLFPFYNIAICFVKNTLNSSINTFYSAQGSVKAASLISLKEDDPLLRSKYNAKIELPPILNSGNIKT